jgi:hypothetical protein
MGRGHFDLKCSSFQIHCVPISFKCPTGHRVDNSCENWTQDLRTLSRCRKDWQDTPTYFDKTSACRESLLIFVAKCRLSEMAALCSSLLFDACWSPPTAFGLASGLDVDLVNVSGVVDDGVGQFRSECSASEQRPNPAAWVGLHSYPRGWRSTRRVAAVALRGVAR